MNIKEELSAQKDEQYATFHSRLVPNVPREKILGVRIPDLRALAKKAVSNGEYRAFINELPHEYNDENVLHALIISELPDYDECVSALEEFFPFMDNWGVTDVIAPKVFKKNKEKLLEEIERWLSESLVYEKRLALGMLMKYFLDADFKSEYLEWAAAVHSDEYYVNMMIAWFFAEALAKQWESAIVFLENNALDVWVHNKTVSKARESFRITKEQKEYLKLLKR